MRRKFFFVDRVIISIIFSWNSLCQPNTCGGHRIQHLKDHNTFFLLKCWGSIFWQIQRLCGLASWDRNIERRCWRDNWIQEIGPLINLISSSANIASDCSVAEERTWNMELFRVWLSEEIIGRITSIPPLHPLARSDKIAWVGTFSSWFSVKSVSRMIEENSWNSMEDAWNQPWKFQGPQRVRVLLWLAFKQRLLTQVEQLRRRIGSDARCSIC